jgi:hypothetical protein
MAELPREVLERLSVHARMKVAVGTGVTTEVAIAPLSRQLFLLVQRGGALERALLEDPAVTAYADSPDGDWLVRVTGRAVPGRTVQAEPRRPELVHWLPDGASPSALVAVRLHAERLEFIRGKGPERTRVEGPVPGGAPPPTATRWALMASEGIAPAYFAAAALDFVGLLYLHEEADERMGLLVVMFLASASMLAGTNLLHQAGRGVRWREGLEPSAEESGVVLGWTSAAHLQRAGWSMLMFGLLLAVCLGGGSGWRVAVWAIVASGAPIFGPFFFIRHLLRRRDAALEIG